MRKTSCAITLVAAIAVAAAGPARAVSVVEVHAITHADSGVLLGGSAEGGWLEPGITASTMGDGGTYRDYGMDGPAGEPCPDTYVVALADGPGAMAIGADWNAMPRTPRLHDPDQRVYRAAAAVWLREQGLETPAAELEQIIRIDLEGDGVMEIVVEAEYYEGNGVGVFDISGGEPELVFNTGCGA